MDVCDVEICDEEVKKRKWCNKHYRRWLRSGNPLLYRGRIEGEPIPDCKVPECDQEVYTSKGYCQKHYTRLRRNGTTELVREKGISRSRKSEGYVRLTMPDGRFMYEHRYIMEQHLGRELFDDETVHHLNGVRDDNRLENLELWSSSHPKGQRVSDKVEWAKEILRRYNE